MNTPRPFHCFDTSVYRYNSFQEVLNMTNYKEIPRPHFLRNHDRISKFSFK